jgi:Pentapeptide repeats (9 copies)
MDDQVSSPPYWPACAHRDSETDKPCIGRRVDGFDHCLAHLETAQLDWALQRLGPGADLHASGTCINAELFARILRSVATGNEPARFGDAYFTRARFPEGVSFAGVSFTGAIWFNGARFDGDARFDGAEFGADTRFDGAEFGGDARFGETQFCGVAKFDRARFGGDARFDGADFQATARFGGAQFGSGALFDGAAFTGDARFHGANFGGDARFVGAHFGQDAGFDGAQFGWAARFVGARFEKAASLGPLAAAELILQRAVFARPVVIEAAAALVTCNDVTWESGVTLRLRYARVDLTGAKFTAPSFIVGTDEPFGLTPGFARLDESNVRRRVGAPVVPKHVGEGQAPDLPVALARRPPAERRAPDDPWMPAILSLRGADDSNLFGCRVDFSQHRRGVRLVLYQSWRVLVAIGQGLLEVLKFIGQLVGSLIGQTATAVLGVIGKSLLAVVLGFSVFATARAWLATRYHWLYVAVITVVAIVVAAVVFGARRWIAWRCKRAADRVSLPVRTRYSQTSVWYASHGDIEVGPHSTRRGAVHELVTLRWRLHKTGLPREYVSVDGLPSGPAVDWRRVQQRLRAWADFPADRADRPIVLLSPRVLTAPLPGAKVSPVFGYSLIGTAPCMAAQAWRALRRSRGASTCSRSPTAEITDGLSVLGEALQHRYRTSAESRDAQANLIDWHRLRCGSPAEPLVMRIAGQGTARFLTDRGEQKLPAWEVRAQGLRQPIWVLDPETSRRAWRPPGLEDHEWSWQGSVAQLTANRHTVALSFYVVAGKDTVYPGADVQPPRAAAPQAEAPRPQDGAAVAVIPVPVVQPPKDGGSPESSRRFLRRCELSAPLGRALERQVLLDGYGSPVLVRGQPSRRARLS